MMKGEQSVLNGHIDNSACFKNAILRKQVSFIWQRTFLCVATGNENVLVGQVRGPYVTLAGWTQVKINLFPEL